MRDECFVIDSERDHGSGDHALAVPRTPVEQRAHLLLREVESRKGADVVRHLGDKDEGVRHCRGMEVCGWGGGGGVSQPVFSIKQDV